MTAEMSYSIPIRQSDDYEMACDICKYQILVILPAYNEEHSIGNVLKGLQQYKPDLLVIDDGSSDETSQIAEKAGARIFQLDANQGKGAALNIGFHEARLKRPDAVVTIDADGQHLPEELPLILTPILKQKSDICVGSRYLKGRPTTPFCRRLGHKLFNLATYLASGIPLSDSQSGYRAFSPRAIDLIRFKSSDFSVESEMQFLARQHGLEIREVPITVRYLENKKRPVILHGLIVIKGIIILTLHYRLLFSCRLFLLMLLIVSILRGFIIPGISHHTFHMVLGYSIFIIFLANLCILLFSPGMTSDDFRDLLLDLFDGFTDKDNNK